jgi:hypothetical protein
MQDSIQRLAALSGPSRQPPFATVHFIVLLYFVYNSVRYETILDLDICLVFTSSVQDAR